ncbi:DUF481 domain-containing protein [bacterium]|nr:DUF481 domain-containing protein [bacterium]
MKTTTQLTLASVVALTGGLATQTANAQDAKKPDDAPKWKQNAALGLTLTKGNSDTALFTASYAGSKKWSNNEVSLGLNGGYGENDGTKNNEFVNGFGQYNWLFGKDNRWYGFGRVGALYDGIAKIDYRVTVAAGLGYYFLKEGVNDNKRFNLSAEVGPGYVIERVGGLNNDYATIYAAEKFTWKITDKSRLWQTLDFTPQLDDLENNVTDLEIGVASKITEAIDLRVVLTDTYRSRPAATFKHNDLKLVAGIGYTF